LAKPLKYGLEGLIGKRDGDLNIFRSGHTRVFFLTRTLCRKFPLTRSIRLLGLKLFAFRRVLRALRFCQTFSLLSFPLVLTRLLSREFPLSLLGLELFAFGQFPRALRLRQTPSLLSFPFFVARTLCCEFPFTRSIRLLGLKLFAFLRFLRALNLCLALFFFQATLILRETFPFLFQSGLALCPLTVGCLSDFDGL
jgi:hypothetical protein